MRSSYAGFHLLKAHVDPLENLEGPSTQIDRSQDPNTLLKMEFGNLCHGIWVPLHSAKVGADELMQLLKNYSRQGQS